MVDGPPEAMDDWPINVDQIAQELGAPEVEVRRWTEREDFPHRDGDNGRGDGSCWRLRKVKDWLATPEGRRLLAEAREQVDS